MSTYKTPGVYVEEIPGFPPSVAEVETAIPAFIGYTERAQAKGSDLRLKPTKISSLREYETFFGGPKTDDIAVSLAIQNDGSFRLTGVVEPSPKFILYYCLRMFFDNGGGHCYIISVGDYSGSNVELGNGSTVGLQDGLSALQNEDEPTLIVIPESINMSSSASYQTLVESVLSQCNALQDRFAIFDIYDGDKPLDTASQSANRALYGNNHLKYGATYYPFIKTSLNYAVTEDETNVQVTLSLDPSSPANTKVMTLADLRSANATAYRFVESKLKQRFVVLPPSSAIAGVYAEVDMTRGVWKAPANVSLRNVIEPIINIDNATQRGLNVDVTSGKSINAIRHFTGRGTRIWGARTLAGNDNEWRYIPVRRFSNMVEESIRKSISWAVFEPNDANTWAQITAMIEPYLIQKWRDGALMGASPKEALFVHCGLGKTMTAQDILEGRMIVEIGMAIVRPAEFTILSLSLKLPSP